MLAQSLKLLILEIVQRAATERDWQAICEQLVANVCDALEQDASTGA